MTKFHALFLVIGSILGLLSVHAQQNQVENYPLSTFSVQSCEEMIETHTFAGTCCALNTTAGNGCVVNVADGNCVVRGQYWTIDFTSNSVESCPPSEFIVPGVEVPTEAPTASASMLSIFVAGLSGIFALVMYAW